MKKEEQEAMTFQLEAQLLINQFYELETDGKKMDYDTAVECAKVASKKMIEGGNLLLPEDRLYWRCVLKQCDLLHSQEYLIESLKRDEKKYNTTTKANIEIEQTPFSVPSEQVISIGQPNEYSPKFPKEKGLYLCRFKDGSLKLCDWHGEYWETMDKVKIYSHDIIPRWIDLESIVYFITQMPI